MTLADIYVKEAIDFIVIALLLRKNIDYANTIDEYFFNDTFRIGYSQSYQKFIFEHERLHTEWNDFKIIEVNISISPKAAEKMIHTCVDTLEKCILQPSADQKSS